jgi:stalled ribosome rescue protein Dom34
VERAHAKTVRATVGLETTRSAIEMGAVEELLLTQAAWAKHPGEVEGVVSGTLMQGGLVEHVDGDAARTLDAEGGGIGALLRFPTPPSEKQ